MKRTLRLLTIVFVACALSGNAAHAGDRPLTGVSLDGPSSLGTVSPGQTSDDVLLSAFAPAPAGETMMTPPDGIVIPDLGLNFNWGNATIIKSKLVDAATDTYDEAGAQNGTVSLAATDETPDGRHHANLSASFPDPGKYRISVSVTGQWWAGTGDYYVGTSNTAIFYLNVVAVTSIYPDPDVDPEIMSGAMDDDDHTIVIFARISEPMAGVTVRFEVVDGSPSTTAASLSVIDAVTDADGVAQTVLKSSNTGEENQSVTVKAYVSGGNKSDLKQTSIALLLPDNEYGAPDGE